MAISISPFLQNFKWSLNETIVVKQAHKTIVTAYPSRERVTYSKSQQVKQKSFAQAVAYARAIVNDPVKKELYSTNLPAGKRLYNAAIQEYLNPQPVPFSSIQAPKKKKGIINDLIVIKEYSDKYARSSKPDMTRVVYNENQKKQQSRFARAVTYARSILADPVKKAALQKRLAKGKKVYHAAIKEYMQALS